MSVLLMSAAFRSTLPPTQRFVFVALCDCANDQGECYPSINNLSRKTGLGERSIQKSIAYLERNGYVRRELRAGRSTVYWLTLNPRTRCTPEPDTPPHHVHPTPAPRAPRTISEPSTEPSENLNVPDGTFVIGVADDATGVDEACEPKHPALPATASLSLADAPAPQADGDPLEATAFTLQAARAETAPRIGLPPCPHQRIIALYAERLPTLPQPRVWEGTRERNLAARWRWVLTARKPSGGRYAETAEEAVAFFDRFFAYVAKSDFLSGRSGKWGGCSLPWLAKAENFAKVVEGAYENREAA